MTGNELYNAIFKRKSVRKYEMAPLEEEKINRVLDFSKGVKTLDDGIKYELSFQSSEEVKSLFAVKAPHYICFYSEKKEGHLANAGFILQQLDLFLSASGMGSCWVGMAKPPKEAPQMRNGMEFVIMLAFGNAAEPVHRESISEFKRNSLSEITAIKDADQLLEAARLAPSAANSQPWHIGGNAGELIISRKKLNIIKSQLYGRLNQVDIGIALCHLWLAGEQQGKRVTISLKQEEGISCDGEFMAMVRIENK